MGLQLRIKGSNALSLWWSVEASLLDFRQSRSDDSGGEGIFGFDEARNSAQLQLQGFQICMRM